MNAGEGGEWTNEHRLPQARTSLQAWWHWQNPPPPPRSLPTAPLSSHSAALGAQRLWKVAPLWSHTCRGRLGQCRRPFLAGAVYQGMDHHPLALWELELHFLSYCTGSVPRLSPPSVPATGLWGLLESGVPSLNPGVMCSTQGCDCLVAHKLLPTPGLAWGACVFPHYGLACSGCQRSPLPLCRPHPEKRGC